MKYLLFLLFFINPSLSCFIGLVFSFWLLYLGKKAPTVINPYYLFLSTPMSLMLYNYKYSEFFLSPLVGKTLVVITLAILFFIFGLYSYKHKRKIKIKDDVSFWTIFILGVLPFLIGIIKVGIPILSDNPDLIKARFFIPIIGQFTVFLFLSMIIAFKRKSRILIYLSLIANVIFNILLVTKFSMGLLGILLIFCILKYSDIRFTKKLTFILTLILIPSVLFLFSLFGSIRNSTNTEYHWQSEIKFENLFLDKQGSILYAPYFYLVSPWTNVDYNIQQSNGKDHSRLLTLNPIISVLQLDQYFKKEEKLIKNQPWNTHTFLIDFYLDFGVLGVLFLPFFLGRAVKYIYNNSIYRQNTIDDMLWVYFAFATFMMFFSNHFTSVGYPITSLVILSSFRFIYKILKFK